jgi:hypothetical protein
MEFSNNFSSINLLVIFGAAIAANLVGALWYSPFLFGKLWRAAAGLGKSTGTMKNPVGTFISAFVLQFLAACMIGGLLGHNAGFTEGSRLGALLGFALVFTAIGMINLYEDRPKQLVLIHGGYNIVALCIMGAIVGQWN